jgi:hypothetical protein
MKFMKIVALAALMAAFVTPAFAAPAPVAAAPVAAPALTIDTPIVDLVANEKAKAVLDANFPGMTSHPMFDSFKGMSLKAVQPMSGGKITDEAIAKTAAELAAIK